MDLLPQELREQIPPLSSTQGEDDPMVWVRFFNPPWGLWSWFVVEGAPHEADEYLLFGLVAIGAEKTLDHFTLSDIAAISGTYGLIIERDHSFVPCRLSVVHQHY